MKKAFIRITFVFILLAPVFVTYSVLQYHKHQVRRFVKHQIIQGIDKDQLVLLKFHLEEVDTILRWKHAKEFEFSGEMYDIVENEIHGDSIFYYCWWDHEETQLSRQLTALTSGLWDTDPLHKNQNEKLSNLLRSLFWEKSILQEFLFGENKKAKIIFYGALYQCSVPQPDSPPPQQLG